MRRILAVIAASTVVAAGFTILPPAAAAAAPRGDVAFGHHADHSGKALHHMNLDGIVAHHSRFEGTTLHQSSFRGARLHRSSFVDATMHRSKFGGASLHHSRFIRTTMHHSSFRGATMHRSRFVGIDLRKSNLTNASLHHSTFIDSDLRGIVARKADLRGIDVSSARSSRAASTTSSTSSLVGAVLSGSNLSGADLSGVDLRGANLSNATMRGTNLSGADLRTANLSGADLSTANLSNANLSGLNLSTTILNGANLTGATTTGATLPTGTSSKLCAVVGTNIDLGGGLFAERVTRGILGGSVVLVAPNGALINGTYSCTWATGRVTDWRITVTGDSGSFRAPIQGLALTGSLSGSIDYGANGANWRVSAPATIQVGTVIVSGTYAVSSAAGWSFTPASASGAVTHDGTTYTIASVTGRLSGSGARESGGLAFTTAQSGRASAALLAGLPAGWTAASAITATPTAGASVTDVATWTFGLQVTTASASGDDSITWKGSMAASPYTLLGRGQIVIGSAAAPVTGAITVAGLGAPTWQLSASVDSVIGEGATVTGTLSASSSQSGVTGTLQVAPASGDFTFDVTADFESSTSWTMTATATGSSDWTTPGLGGVGTFTIPVSSISGTIVDEGNDITWALTATLNPWTGPQGVSLAGAVEITNQCPDADLGCSDLPGIFIGASGTVTTAQLGSLNVEGAGLADGTWMVVQGSATGSASYVGPNGGSISVTNPAVSVWKGSSRPPCPIDSIVLPDISGDGWAMELSGTLSASIPAVGSASLQGCVDINSSGEVLIGQNVNGATTIGGQSVSGSAKTSRTTSYGVVTGAQFTSWAWTNADIDDGTTVTLGGQTFDLAASTVYLAGTVTLRGYFASELGLSSTPRAPVLISFRYNADNVRDSTFSLSSTIDPDVSAYGIDLTAVTLSATKQGSDYAFALEADASVTQNGSTFDVSGVLSAGSSLGKGYLRFSVTATGTIPDSATSLAQYDYLVDDYLGIDGLHLWSVTGQLELVDGFPGAGLSTTTYINPAAQPVLLQGTTWVQGGSTFNISEADACISVGFNSTGTSTYFQINGGVFETYEFEFAFAESGCTVGSVNIPAGMSFTLDTQLGSDESLYITMSETIDADGNPSYDAEVDYVGKIGGIQMDGSLVISMTVDEQDVSFSGDMVMPFGSMSASFDLDTDKDGNMTVDGDAFIDGSVGQVFAWGRTASSSDGSDDGIFSVQDLTYSVDMTVGPDNCGSFTSDTSGTLSYGKRSGLGFTGDISVNCGILNVLDFEVDYYKDDKLVDQLIISYSSKTGLLYGFIQIQPDLWETSRKHLGYTYKRHVQFTITVTVSIDTLAASKSYVTITLSLSADDVSGTGTCTFAASGDDSCTITVKVKPTSTFSWSDSWSW